MGFGTFEMGFRVLSDMQRVEQPIGNEAGLVPY